MRRLAIVASHPIQYQAPWFRELSRHVDLEVFFCHRQDGAGQAAAGFGREFEWDVPLLEGYRHHWLENVARKPNVESFAGCDTPGVADVLEHGRFDACLVNGWYLKSYLQAVRACRRIRLPVLMRGDSQLKTPRRRIVTIGKVLPYRLLLARIDAHLYVGRANYDYLRHYRVPSERLFFSPHFVDNDWFAERAGQARRDGTARRLREAHGIDADALVFLFAGKFIDKKRPFDFIDAVEKARRDSPAVCGLMVGAGPLQHEVERRIAAGNVPVRVVGFRNQTEMPACYAAADCLVLPSDGRETWGLVVNEAMACGLPAVVSQAAGCAEDLIDEGQTGLTVPVGDTDALAAALAAMARRIVADRDGLQAAVRRKIDRYRCEAATAGAMKALEYVAAGRASAPRPVRRGAIRTSHLTKDV